MIALISSTIASTTRLWSGTTSRQNTKQPALPLTLYDRESCPRSRLVRETLTLLNLDVEIRPCPIGGKRFTPDLPKGRTPYLIDPNKRSSFTSTGSIINHLFTQYAHCAVPNRYQPGLINLALSSLASAFRLNKGGHKQASRQAKQRLTLYSFESSPYSRLVREQLSELELPHLVINMGKQQWADMGPATCRWSNGPYKPLPDSKRSRFLAQHHKMQVPYLEDPNTNTALFESKDIIHYLRKQYLLH